MHPHPPYGGRLGLDQRRVNLCGGFIKPRRVLVLAQVPVRIGSAHPSADRQQTHLLCYLKQRNITQIALKLNKA